MPWCSPLPAATIHPLGVHFHFVFPRKNSLFNCAQPGIRGGLIFSFYRYAQDDPLRTFGWEMHKKLIMARGQVLQFSTPTYDPVPFSMWAQRTHSNTVQAAPPAPKGRIDMHLCLLLRKAMAGMSSEDI